MNHNFPKQKPEGEHRLDSIDALIAQTKSERIPFTPEQAEAIAKFDKQAAKNDDLMREISDVTGVLSGVKPSTFIESSDTLEQFCDVMRLAYQPSNIRGLVAVSHSEELANELVASFEGLWDGTRNSPDDSRAIGKLLGYPATATDYFIDRVPTLGNPTHEQLPFISPEEFEGTVQGEFTQIILSPEHWRQEIEDYVVPLESSVRDLAPATYKAYEKRVRKEKFARKIGKFVLGHEASTSPFANTNVAVKGVR